MAQRRGFHAEVINSGRFLRMSASLQVLYFHLNMNADDYGFCEYFIPLRQTHCTIEELKLLESHEFIKILDDEKLSITDWWKNNGTPNKANRQAVYKQDGSKSAFIRDLKKKWANKDCIVCGMKMIEETPHMPSLDHIKSMSNGGRHVLENFRVICLRCNLKKKNKDD